MYIQGVESLITARGRDNYDQAGIHLQIVPGLFERLGKSQSWDNLITDHRERNHRLPALQDELNKSRLWINLPPPGRYNLIIMDKQALRDNLETVISSINEISLVYLFGSQVGGKVKPMSDYDLGVLVDDGGGENHVLAVLAHELQKKLDRVQIDIVPLKRAPVELSYAIISQGMRVYQRDVVTRIEFEARIMSLYGDYLCVLRAEREDILRGRGNDRRVQRYREALRRTERTLSQIERS